MSKSNIELAEQLFETLSVFAPKESQYKYEVDKILKTCNSKEEILHKVIELCGDSTDPRYLSLLSKVYVWAGANYRQQAIDCLKKYISVGVYIDNSDDVFAGPIRVYRKNLYLAEAYDNLGKCFEGEYLFDEAFDCFKQAHAIAPAFYGVLPIARILLKKGSIDCALDVLRSERNSPFYNDRVGLDKFGLKTIYQGQHIGIENTIEEYENKKKKGYVYKPRGKKTNI